MEPRTSKNSLSSKAIALCFLVVCLLVSCVSALGHNVVIRENVSAKRKQDLVARLRAISGLTKLNFDEAGVLTLGQPYVNGSAEARSLLAQAVNGDKVIIIEDASGRSDVAFCRVVPGRWVAGDGTKMPAFVVLIDFADFKQLLGDAEARAAFDVGWGFLHELDHVVADSTDATEASLLGDCESHINVMRNELGLPQRVEYFYSETSLKTDPNFTTRFVKLPFESFDPQTSRKRRYWIAWDATTVGGLTTTGQTAVVRESSPKK
ncbi:MAG TPA: hypothetical protein VI306_13170 [Pyrinomonadaceae bacterium]